MSYSNIRKSLERNQQSLDTMVTGLLTELVKGKRRNMTGKRGSGPYVHPNNGDNNQDGHAEVDTNGPTTHVIAPSNDGLPDGPEAMGLNESVTKSFGRTKRTPKWFEDTVLY